MLVGASLREITGSEAVHHRGRSCRMDEFPKVQDIGRKDDKMSEPSLSPGGRKGK